MNFNSSLTNQKKELPNHKAFLSWCESNGVRFNSVDPLAYFGADGELRGVVSTREIKPYEVMLAVPNKVLITVPKILNDLSLSPVIEQIKEAVEKGDPTDFFLLVTYILKERSLGEESFYHLFFEMVTDIEPAELWRPEDLKIIEWPVFADAMLSAEDGIKQQWSLLQPILLKFPVLFRQ